MKLPCTQRAMLRRMEKEGLIFEWHTRRVDATIRALLKRSLAVNKSGVYGSMGTWLKISEAGRSALRDAV